MRKVYIFSILTFFLISTITIHAQVTQEWVRKFVGSGLDNPAGIAADNSGNIYITGNNNWGFSTADIYLVRYNSSGLQTGGILYNSPYNNHDQAKAIATDINGNVYVAGRVSVNSSTSDIVVIKYNSSMTQQWATIFNTPENYIDDVNAMKVDGSGNIYLAGSIVKGAFEYDYLTVKLNSDGTVLWHSTYDGTANGIDIANDLAVDAVGNVFVTGSSAGVTRRVFFNLSTGYDAVTIQYNADGVQQWVQRYNFSNRFLSAQDAGNSIALDASGNVFVAGYTAPGGNRNCLTLKYSNDGIFQWAQIFNGSSNQNDEARKIAIDISGNVIIGGYTNNGLGSSDVLAVKYNTAGVQQWASSYTAGSNTVDVGTAMGLDNFGNAYVTGQTSVPGIVNSDYLTVKFTSSGTVGWAARYNGPENQTDIASSIAVVNSSRIESLLSATVYVFGSSNNDVVTIKYSQPSVVEPPPIFLSPNKNFIDENTKAFNIYNFPNPVHTYSNFYFELPSDGHIRISLHDALGRTVQIIADGFYRAGAHSKMFKRNNLSAGEYYYRSVFTREGKEIVETRKLLIQK